jgi:hypothetical protein
LSGAQSAEIRGLLPFHLLRAFGTRFALFPAVRSNITKRERRPFTDLSLAQLTGGKRWLLGTPKEQR